MDFFNTTVTLRAIELSAKTLRSGYLSEGAVVKEFEQALESQLGLKHVATVNSGTAALHLALVAAHVKAGDEVVLPCQTFVATALAVMHCGASCVFADIDPYTGNLDVSSVYRHVTDKTKAILAVDWGGYPSDYEPLKFVGRDRMVSVIGDAAHALGATYRDCPVGASPHVDFTCFSFQAIKPLTTADGGAICSRYDWQKEKIKDLRWFNISKDGDKPDELGERIYFLNSIGYKAHMSDYNAALGLGNIDGFHTRLARRRSIANLYFKELANVGGLQLMKYGTDRESSYWLFPLLVEKRLEFVRALKSKGIPSSVVHRRIDKHQLFSPRGINRDLVGQTYFDEHQVHIPVHDSLTDDDVELIVKTIREGWA